MAASMAGLSAMSDLGFGLGDVLGQQTKDQNEEEARKKRLGLGAMGQNPLNFGMTGIASVDLGYAGARGR